MNGLRSDRAMELLTWLLGALIALGLFCIIVLTFGTCGAPRAPSRRAKSISTPSKAIVRRSGADRWESILPGPDALPNVTAGQNYPALICEASLAREAASFGAYQATSRRSGRPERILLSQIHDVETSVTLSMSCPDESPCGAVDMRGRTG